LQLTESIESNTTTPDDALIWSERVNLVSSGKSFKCYFMEPGLINYRDVKGGDVELIKKEAIDEALNTLIGCPLTIGHIPTSINDFTDVANGYIDHAEYDADKGWFVCEGSVDTDTAREMIRKHKGVSVGTKLNTKDFGPGGTWHNIPYGREIKRFKFHHLAIVPPDQRPRFEDAEIRLNTKQNNIMFKWIKSLTSVSKSEQVSELAPSSRIDIGDGKSATLQEMIDVSRNNMCHSVHHDDHVEHEGIRYNVGHLIAAYKSHHGHTVHAMPVNNMMNTMSAPATSATHMGHVPGYDEGTKGHNPIAGMHHPRANAEMPVKEEELKNACWDGYEAIGTKQKNGKTVPDCVPKENAMSEDATEAKADVRENSKEPEVKTEAARNNAAFKSLAEAQLKKGFESASRLNSSGSINDRLARGKNLFGSNTTKN
jgi:hypothetical protein